MPEPDLNENDYVATAVDVHTTGGATPDIKVVNVNKIAVDINLKTLTGGTSPTVTFNIQRKDANGNYQTLLSSAAVNAVGQVAPISVGPGVAEVANKKASDLIGNTVRISWTVAGGPTGATADISVIGEQ